MQALHKMHQNVDSTFMSRCHFPGEGKMAEFHLPRTAKLDMLSSSILGNVLLITIQKAL